MSVGCGSLATILRNQTDYPVGACLQPRCSNIVTSDISCLTEIPSELSSFAVNMTEIYPSNSSNISCGSAFLVDVSLLDSLGTISPDDHDISSWTSAPTTQQWGTLKVGHVPTTLQWGIPKHGPCELKEGSNTFCSSDGQYCWSTMSSTYLCVCSDDSNFDENYSSDVCLGTN